MTTSPRATAVVPLPARNRVLAAVRRYPVFSIAIMVSFVLAAIAAPLLAPHDPELGALAMRFRPPAWQTGGLSEYLLGTDHLGRDVLSRLIYGARVSLTVGVAAVLAAGFLGTSMGLMAGYLGGWVDQVVMRIADAWLALPSLVFAIFLAAITGPSEFNIVIILGAVYWTRYARVIRGEVLSLRERDFVRLAIVTGCSSGRIMMRHLLPNVVNTTIVLATLMLGIVIVTEASLSFLGVGVPPPKPAWGLMLADGKKGMMIGYWWLTVFPGLCIMLVVLAASQLGDWLRDRLDPQLDYL
jgi:peptide/nickel transport system permease protein